MEHIVKRLIKVASYSAVLVAGLAAPTLFNREIAQTEQFSNESLRNATLVGVAHADAPMCGAYVCGSGGGGGDGDGSGDGGGDCGDGGSGDDCS